MLFLFPRLFFPSQNGSTVVTSKGGFSQILFVWSVSTPGKPIPVCLIPLSMSCYGDSTELPTGSEDDLTDLFRDTHQQQKRDLLPHFYSSVLPTAGNAQCP